MIKRIWTGVACALFTGAALGVTWLRFGVAPDGKVKQIGQIKEASSYDSALVDTLVQDSDVVRYARALGVASVLSRVRLVGTGIQRVDAAIRSRDIQDGTTFDIIAYYSPLQDAVYLLPPSAVGLLKYDLWKKTLCHELAHAFQARHPAEMAKLAESSLAVGDSTEYGYKSALEHQAVAFEDAAEGMWLIQTWPDGRVMLPWSQEILDAQLGEFLEEGEAREVWSLLARSKEYDGRIPEWALEERTGSRWGREYWGEDSGNVFGRSLGLWEVARAQERGR